MDPLSGLPDWSGTADPEVHLNYDPLRKAAAAFLSLSEPERQHWVRQYSANHCFPRIDLPKASGLYLLFRLVFDLPAEFPREETKVFGGWLHASTTKHSEPFDLSWPAALDLKNNTVRIDRFRGYRGKGYDAIGEYEYFLEKFHLRSPAILAKVTFLP